MSKKKKHALLSCSGAERWWHCPGSVWLSRQAPEPESSPAAERGTLGHAWAEEMLDEWFNQGAREGVLKAMRSRWKEQDDTLAVQVMCYVRACLDLYQTLVGESDKVSVFLETRVSIFKHTFGTSDFILLRQCGDIKDIYIVDLKTGSHPVDIKDNKQLTLYALGARKNICPEAVNASIYIVQPRINPTIQHATYTAAELDKRYEELEAKHDYAYKVYKKGAKESDFKAGEHCFFCPAKGICDKKER